MTNEHRRRAEAIGQTLRTTYLPAPRDERIADLLASLKAVPK